MASTEFDVVLCGATGFVGRQTVSYFVQHAPAGLRWAVAGRNLHKLRALGVDVPILVFDSMQQDQVDIVVTRTRIIVSTAGPFRIYSDPLVDACVRLGTHYIDISGEAPRIRDLIDRYHNAAIKARVRIVPFCAVSSAPADLMLQMLNEKLGGGLIEAKGFVRMGGGSPSGGTISSIALAHKSGDAARANDPFLLNPERRRPSQAIEQDPTGVHYDRTVAAWTAPSPLGLSDTRAIRRSGALTGNEIVYQEYMAFPGRFGLIQALGFHAVLQLLDVMMRNGPTRRFLQRRLPPGSGPSEKAMDAGWFEIRVSGLTAKGRRAEVVFHGEGDVNRITVKCLCEAAFSQACDDPSLPETYGVLTPSVAFGVSLARRLKNAGIEIR
jgi:short subunit dehydrogenase-like uncharacterized protein